MSRIIKILGMAMVLTTLLVVSMTGTIFAAGGNPDNGNKGEECPYGECVCGGCEPNDYSYKWDRGNESPGPHKAQNGKVSE